MKKIVFIVWLLTTRMLLHTQTQNISESEYELFNNKKAQAVLYGHTIDKRTRNHLSFISIRLKGTTIGAASDAGGHFRLRNLPAGNFVVVASAVGYKTIEVPVSLVNRKTTELHLEMEEDAVLLDNIVVSANRNETKRRDASGIVHVITPRLFENVNAVCLAQGLSFKPGVRIENNCQNCGFQQVRINGLEGPYTQILIDSRPIFSALAGVYGIEQIPVNMIDRVEIVRGGGSALFGSNAIAGTINIITKEPSHNSLTLNHSTTYIGGSSSDHASMMNAALISENGRSGVSVYGSSRQREAWDANNDGFSEIGLIKANNLGFRSYFKTGLQSKLTLEYHNLREFRRGGNLLHMPAHLADIAEQTEHSIQSGGGKWEFFSPDYTHRFQVFSSAQVIERHSYYGAGKDPNAYGLTNDLAFVGGLQYAYRFENLWLMPADLTAGAEYNVNHLKDEQLAYVRQIDQKINIASFFLQNEWKSNKAGILLGMRLDQHNLIQTPIFSPRINLRFNPFHWVSLRASYAEGFRAPQAFDEDLHLTAVGGEVQIILNDPNLQPENSQSVTLSADFHTHIGNSKAHFLAEGFYTNINDVFHLVESGYDPSGNPILMRQNGSGAVVAGVNLEAKWVPTTDINLQGGFTLQQSLYHEPEIWSENSEIAPQRQMFRAPNHYGYITGNWQMTEPLQLSLSGIYTGSMLVQHYGSDSTNDREVQTPRFFDLNVRLAYDIHLSDETTLRFNAGVQNVLNSFQRDFDTGQNRDAGYIYGPSLPRSFFAGARLML